MYHSNHVTWKQTHSICERYRYQYWGIESYVILTLTLMCWQCFKYVVLQRVTDGCHGMRNVHLRAAPVPISGLEDHLAFLEWADKYCNLLGVREYFSSISWRTKCLVSFLLSLTLDFGLSANSCHNMLRLQPGRSSCLDMIGLATWIIRLVIHQKPKVRNTFEVCNLRSTKTYRTSF